MKKAKFLLAAIVVITIISGALAFKVKKVHHIVYCVSIATQICSQLSIVAYTGATLQFQGPPPIVTTYCAIDPSQACTVRVPVYITSDQN
jgi:Na+/H+-translocating membrane pyrophosphatase